MLRSRATRWAVRLGAVATTVAVGVFVFASAAQADIIWQCVGQ
jgi:hypothetical protein